MPSPFVRCKHEGSQSEMTADKSVSAAALHGALENGPVKRNVVCPLIFRQKIVLLTCRGNFALKPAIKIAACVDVGFRRKPVMENLEPTDMPALTLRSQRLTETAETQLKTVLSNITDSLHRVNQPALVIDRMGLVLAINALAEQLFDDDLFVRNRRLVVTDQRAKPILKAFIDQFQTVPRTPALSLASLVVQRRMKRPVLIRIFPLDGPGIQFNGICAVLILSDLSGNSGPQPDLLSLTFGLSAAEARVASLITTGISLKRTANELGVTVETVRSHLKAAFAKTATHRQGELIALLSRV
jgi:DNA-binding CsgD family transcriptional regulator